MEGETHFHVNLLILNNQMLSQIISKFYCCNQIIDEDQSGVEENFFAPDDCYEQNSRMKKVRKPFHPAVLRSGMRMHENQKAKGSSCNARFFTNNSKGTIKFGSQYGKKSEKKEKRDKNAHQKLEKISSREEGSKNDPEEGKHR